MRSVFSAAGTCGSPLREVPALSGITDTGCHDPLSPSTRRVWNQNMTDLAPVLVGACAPRARRCRRRRTAGRAGRHRPRRSRPCRRDPQRDRRSRRRPASALRRLHRLRCARDHLHRPGSPPAAAGQPDPFARGRYRSGDRARGHAGTAAAPPADTHLRAHRRAARRRRDLRRDAERRHHSDRARVRLTRMLR